MNNHKPKAIFFDLGKVLVNFDWEIAVGRIAAQNGGDPASVREFLANPLHDSFEKGELSEQEFFALGQRVTGFDGTLSDFRSYWNEIFWEIPSSVQIVRQLARTHPIYLVSNTNPWHVGYVERNFDWMNLFSERIYSCAVGLRKPDPRIYELALTRAKVTAPDALFIDDRLDNIIGAQQVGMQTVHVPSPELVQLELESLVETSDQPTA